MDKNNHTNEKNLCGRVLFGINNIYTVLVGEIKLLCRIKGKRIKDKDLTYNPLAPGDWVNVLPDPHSQDKGWIEGRKDRQSSLLRYNKKRRAPQVIAANIDALVCITSSRNPPFRPRFIDRMLVSAQIGGNTPIIFVNKCDLSLGSMEKERLKNYKRIGYHVIYGSALTGQGIKELCKVIKGKTSVFTGQSGVGKSALLNKLDPNINLKVGDISQKYNRGIHTTNYAIMINILKNTWVIDTPGIRELDVFGIESKELAHYFPEFDKIAQNCSFNSCRHIDEPGCCVRENVMKGIIHSDRYESYIRIFQSLKDFYKESYG